MTSADSSIDTIAAISTPPGRGGIGIVRLSGPEAASIATQLVRLRQPLEHAHARLADVLDENAAGRDNLARIDEAVVTFFAAPSSYTADDLVEIAAHGSPVVLDLLLRRALALGARLAEPGEFTQRAFLAGKLDLTQAEAVRDLIDAQTLTQARQAASQMGGALSRRVAPVKQALVELVALLEAGIDFAEDDLEVTPQSEITRRLDELTPPLAALAASFARGRIVHDGLTLAIVGRPNAGKSSLFNCLVERDRAIVAATPGTTRDTVSERISLDGIPLELVDTAGLREAAEEVEQLGIDRSREALADAALVLLVLDATEPLNDEERRLLAVVENRPAVVAINKSDLLRNTADLPAKKPAIEPVSYQKMTSETTEILDDERALYLGTTSEAAEKLNSGMFCKKGTTLVGPQDADNKGWASAPAAGFSSVSSEICGYSIPALATSALTGEGIPALRERILALATGGAAAEPGMLTSLRHQKAIATAIAALAEAAQANAAAIPHEMLLLDLYRALWALDSLTGQTTSDDILNLIFSTFCIGK